MAPLRLKTKLQNFSGTKGPRTQMGSDASQTWRHQSQGVNSSVWDRTSQSLHWLWFAQQSRVQTGTGGPPWWLHEALGIHNQQSFVSYLGGKACWFPGMEQLRANGTSSHADSLKGKTSPRFIGMKECFVACKWKCSFAPSLKSLEPQEVIPMHFSPFVGRGSWVSET